MIFSFSPNFRVATYAELLRVLVAEIDLYRQLCGITLRELMVNLSISHLILRKMLNGEPVHIYYYLAVILYIIMRSHPGDPLPQQLFDDLKSHFINEINQNH